MARTAKQRAAQRKASLASARKRRKSAKLQKYGPRRGKRTGAQTAARAKRRVRRGRNAAAAIYVGSALVPTAAGAYARHTLNADKRRNSTRGRNKAAKRSMSASQRRASRNRVKDQRYLNKHMTVTVGPARPIRQGAIAGRRIRSK